MFDYIPYHISHIHLEEHMFTSPDSLLSEDGNYVVFWWRKIAIGDIYLAPDRDLSEDNYLKLMMSAITPSLTYYANQIQNTKDWESLIVQKREREWASFMDAIFGPELPQDIPQSVPVSAIICTRNRPKQLKRCIKMLSQLSCTAKEIIVVDNAPDDNRSFEVVKEFNQRIPRWLCLGVKRKV